MTQFGKSTRRSHIVPVVFAITALTVISYYVGTVWRARVRTPELVRSALSSDWIDMRGSDLSAWQKCALLTVQDPGFYEHRGVKSSPLEAFTRTTITQSIVKGLYFEEFKPGIRKIRQTLIARYALDPLVSKEDQLTLFVNMTWFGLDAEGKPITGFADAARAFFDKPIIQLTETQYLTLIAMLIAPNRLNPRTHPKENAERVAELKRLVANQCGGKK